MNQFGFAFAGKKSQPVDFGNSIGCNGHFKRLNRALQPAVFFEVLFFSNQDTNMHHRNAVMVYLKFDWVFAAILYRAYHMYHIMYT